MNGRALNWRANNTPTASLPHSTPSMVPKPLCAAPGSSNVPTWNKAPQEGVPNCSLAYLFVSTSAIFLLAIPVTCVFTVDSNSSLLLLKPRIDATQRDFLKGHCAFKRVTALACWRTAVSYSLTSSAHRLRCFLHSSSNRYTSKDPATQKTIRKRCQSLVESTENT